MDEVERDDIEVLRLMGTGMFSATINDPCHSRYLDQYEVTVRRREARKAEKRAVTADRLFRHGARCNRPASSRCVEGKAIFNA